MRVLLTGAFGNVGTATLRELLDAGNQVRCFDVDAAAARKAAAAFRGRVEPHWGDIADAGDVARAVAERDVVIHNAAVIPPSSERVPELTRRVNAEGTRNIVAACEAQPKKPKLIFSSSISVLGPPGDRPPPRRADEPMLPTDHYSHSKVECEEMIRASNLEWVILRLGAVLPERLSRSSDNSLRDFFRVDPDSRVEYVHPRDVALAQTNAATCPEAAYKVLLIGGGEGCQIRMRDLNAAYLDARGIGNFPDSAFGKDPFYTDWMDTEESERLLRYQRHSFADHRRNLERQLRFVRPLYRVLRGPIRKRMLQSSPQAE